jgi:hypothetical protein
MKIITINRNIGSAFVKDENDNKMYRVDINPFPLFVEINENAYSESRAFMHGYVPLDNPIDIKDKKAIIKYIADEWVKNSDRKIIITSEEKYYKLKRERLEIILRRASPKGIKNVMLPKVKRLIENKEFKKAKLYLDVLLNLKNIAVYDDVKNNNELYNRIQKLKEEYERKKEEGIKKLKKLKKFNKHPIKIVFEPKNTNNTRQPTIDTCNKLSKHISQSYNYNSIMMGC